VIPVPPATAVNTTGLPEQMLVLSDVMDTVGAGTDATVTLTGVELTFAGLAHVALLVSST